jgi:hypothetical protein
MLRLPKAVRLRGTSSLLGISSTNRVSTHAYTTLSSASHNKLVHAGKPLITLGRDRKLSATFSTQSQGLRKVMWTDYCYDLIWDLEVKRMMETNCRPIPDRDDLIDHAMFAFDMSNPFGDIDDQNCVIVFERAVATTDFEEWFTHEKMNAAASFLTMEAAIVQKELHKVVVPDGQTVSPIYISSPLGTKLTSHRPSGLYWSDSTITIKRIDPPTPTSTSRSSSLTLRTQKRLRLD